MNLATKIKECRTPAEAIMLLAQEIDRLNELVKQPPPDAWAQPLDWRIENEALDWADNPPKPVLSPDAQAQIDDMRRQQLAALREKIAAEHDPQDRRALEAQLRLALDTPANIVLDGTPQGERPVIESDGTNGEVEIPPVSEERQQVRYQWAIDKELHTFLPQFTQDEAADAYAKGGPLWLYLGNRDAVMAMPPGWRQELVEELSRDSEVEARNMGADILKQEGSISSATAIQYTDQVR